MSSTTRELSLQERFRSLASYTASEVVPSFHYPDNSNLDAQASTSNGSLGFRLIPHHFETCPRWDNDLIMTTSGMREVCRKEARVVKISPGHRAWLQYGGRLVEYMIEGGAEIDIYGRGSQHVNIYGFAEDKWDDPTIGLHYLDSSFHGYISERLFEAIIDGLGRQRTQGLGRLVASSIETEGGVRKDVTRGTSKAVLPVRKSDADTRLPAILATTGVTTTTTGPSIPEARSSLPAQTTCRPVAPTLSPSTIQSSSPSTSKQVSTRQSSPAVETAHSSSKSHAQAPKTLQAPAKTNQKKPEQKQTRKSSPPGSSTLSLPSVSATVASARKLSPPAQLPAPTQKKPATTSAAPKPSEQVVVAPAVATGRQNSTKASTSCGELVAPAMVRSEGVSSPGRPGESKKQLSGAQRRKLRKLAISVKMAVAAAKEATTAMAPITAAPFRDPKSPPATLASCRASAAATLREVTARAEQRNAITHPLPARPLAVNSIQRLAPLDVLAPGISGAKVCAPSELRVAKNDVRIANLTILELEAELESRKRKSSPTQPNLRGETESLFRKNARLRQPHDWRLEDGQEDRRYDVTRFQERNPSSLNGPHYPGRLNDVPYPRTPIRHSQGSYYDRDFQEGNQREERRTGRGLEHPVVLNNGRPSRFDQGGYYPGEFGGRYVTVFASEREIPNSKLHFSLLDYGDNDQTSPRQPQASLAKGVESAPSHQPVVVPQVPTKGPKFSRSDIIGSNSLVSAFAQTLREPRIYSKLHPQAENTTTVERMGNNLVPSGFNRAVSPPTSSQYSLRATAASFFPAPASSAPATSTDPRTRPPPSSYSSLFYPPSFNSLPGGPPKPTSVFAAGSAQLVVGGIEVVESSDAVNVKKEESDVFGPGLAEAGWEVVKRSKKVGVCAVSNDSGTLTRSRATQGDESHKGQTQVRLRRLPRDISQTSNSLHTLQDIKAVVASPARPSLHKGASFKPTLSSIGATRIEDEWTTEMDMEISGEPLLDQGESWELTKTPRQNKVAKSSLKTREQRKSKEFFKWLGQEEIRLWEEFKKENGPLRIGGLKKKEWVPVSGAI
ncbi:hypothetical protein P7C70_g8066, partial [Phenoliferia sp. Uapishka_3]